MFSYVLLLIAVACFTAQFAFTKLYEAASRRTVTAALVMLVVASVIGAVLFLAVGGFRVQVSVISALWALAFGVIMVPYYLLGIRALSLGSLAVYSMFMMLGGMLVPFFYGVVLLGEPVSTGKGLGAVLLSVCVIVQAMGSSDTPKPQQKACRGKFFVLCLLIFLINGMTGVIAKAHALSRDAVDEASFTVLSCAVTAVLGLVLLLFSKERSAGAVREALSKKPLLLMSALGAAAHTGNFLHLIAAESVPASVQFPLVSGGVIVLSALVSAFVFREKLSRREWLCIAGAFLSTCLFAF